jgi:large conductance mechanosensitive channel
MLKEFKDFLMRGNVLDLAVAVVVGSAFTEIVNALVEHIIMPIVLAVSGNAEIGDFVVAIGPANFGVGAFIQAVIDFFIIALVIFLFIKVITSVGDRFKKEEPEEVEVPTAEKYLEEIRDLLAAQQQSTETSSKNDTSSTLDN